MKLLELIKDLDVVETVGNFNVDISEIKNYSNLVSKGDLFICLKGLNYDGHEYISQVESYGGVAVIAERKTDTFLTQIIVKDTRIAMSVIARAFYGKIDKKLKLIGVVGTNGKTSVCHLIRSIFEKNGVKCGVIGTLGTYYGDKYLEPSLTTPDPLDLFKIFSDMYSDGVQVVVMEVSAHARHLKKVYGLQFEVGVFTNFSRDHLDYFTDMESYRETKLSFFKNNLCMYVVSNSDDKLGREISNYNKKLISYINSIPY